MAQLKITAFCGSLRAASWNKKLLLHGCEILKSSDCDINYVDLKSLELPIFDEDLEEKIGMHPGGQKLVDAINDADALIIGCPEYNGSTSGALKNAIDWVSRADKNPFAGKPILLVGTSSGYWGAIRSNMATRLVLTHLQAYVIPTQVTIPKGQESLASGKLVDPGQIKLLQSACDALLKFTTKMKS